jgi:hypothetical protein
MSLVKTISPCSVRSAVWPPADEALDDLGWRT